MAREIHLTKEGYERLKQELHKWQERLTEITQILQELMESSDDYDDSGLEDAKREKARIETRIDQLEEVLSRAHIIEGGEALDKVGLGSLIVLQDVDTGESFEIRIVAPAEASVLETPMKVSDESPVGSALVGRKVGEAVRVETPEGVRDYRVLSILG